MVSAKPSTCSSSDEVSLTTPPAPYTDSNSPTRNLADSPRLFVNWKLATSFGSAGVPRQWLEHPAAARYPPASSFQIGESINKRAARFTRTALFRLST